MLISTFLQSLVVRNNQSGTIGTRIGTEIEMDEVESVRYVAFYFNVD